jgi:hypothetical protein
MKDELRGIEEIEIIGDPPFMVTFRSDSLNVYQILEFMTQRGWGLSGLHLPPSAHLCVTLRHTQEGVKERFVEDMRAAIQYVKEHPEAAEGMGPIYGMASAVETRGLVKSVFNWFLDMLYSV